VGEESEAVLVEVRLRRRVEELLRRREDIKEDA